MWTEHDREAILSNDATAREFAARLLDDVKSVPEALRREPKIAERVNALVEPTMLPDGSSRLFTPEQLAERRQRFVAQLRNHLRTKYGEPARDSHADIVLGPPGSGKNRLVSDDQVRKWTAWLIDSDDAKSLMPEYRGGLTAGAVHEEASYVDEDVLFQAMLTGSNIVRPLVGKTTAKVQRLIRNLKRLGYTVDVHYVHIEPEQSVERVLERFEARGRWIDIKYVKDVDGLPEQTYNSLRKAVGSADGPNAVRYIENTAAPGTHREVPERGAGVLAEPGGV